MAIDGVVKKVGITDIINVNSNDVTDINMGLIYKAKFDLKLVNMLTKLKLQMEMGQKNIILVIKKWLK